MERWSPERHKDYRDKKLDNGREGQLDMELTDAAVQNLKVVRAWEEEKEIFVGSLWLEVPKKYQTFSYPCNEYFFNKRGKNGQGFRYRGDEIYYKEKDGTFSNY